MLINESSGKKLSSSTQIAETVLSRGIGLMFSLPNKVKDNSLVFVCSKEYRWSLHMWFVFYPIDVLFLDGNRRVVEIKENFLPFMFYFPREKSRYVIEMASGTVIGSGTSVGDVISWN